MTASKRFDCFKRGVGWGIEGGGKTKREEKSHPGKKRIPKNLEKS